MQIILCVRRTSLLLSSYAFIIITATIKSNTRLQSLQNSKKKCLQRNQGYNNLFYDSCLAGQIASALRYISTPSDSESAREENCVQSPNENYGKVIIFYSTKMTSCSLENKTMLAPSSRFSGRLNTKCITQEQTRSFNSEQMVCFTGFRSSLLK